MGKNNLIIKSLYQVIDEFNENEDNNCVLVKSPDTVLLGKGSNLDSIGLVNFIVAVEQNIEENLEIEITLADENALRQDESPFTSIKSLTEYIEMLVDDKL